MPEHQLRSDFWRAVAKELRWLAIAAAVALTATWYWFDFTWPDGPTTTFIAPYSIVVASPWPMAGGLFAGAMLVIALVRWRRARRARATS